MRKPVLTTALAAALTFGGGLSAVAAPKLPDFYVDETKLPFEALEGTETTRLWGVHKNAGYRIEVPKDWNGELVVYAHGFRGTGPELTVSNPRIRQYLIANGYAWAASSYSKNYYDVQAGVQDTHAITTLFNGLVGKPSRTYLIGHSMGGHITGAAIEQYPKLYDGAMPMCGVMGDVTLFDYFAEYNLAAQAIGGIDAVYPNPDFQTAVRPQLVAALGPNFPFVLNEAGETLKAVTENLSGGDRPTYDLAWARWAQFLLQFGSADGTVNGILNGNVVDNTNRVYQIDSDPALSSEELALNAAVLRVAADPNARGQQGLRNIPAITGKLPIPVVSLHTLGDLFVPFSMQQIYAERAAAQGRDDLLVVRAIRDTGHCGFSASEQEQGFADLVSWVEHGVKPAGDDILNPEAVADPAFGCQFTTPTRPYATCP
jgi:pimeloyl-ACP methyl ester carboxylesterase